MNFLKYASCVIVLIGALNWGLIGLFNFNLVTAIFGEGTLLTKIVYIIVGISAIIAAVFGYLCSRNKYTDY